MDQQKLETKTVEMTTQEMAEFEAFQKQKHAKAEELRLQRERENYKSLIYANVEESFNTLMAASDTLRHTKKLVFDTFDTAVKLKSELFKVKEEQKTHTFTNSEGDKRIMIGVYTVDNYRDTVNEGVEIVREVVNSLIHDENSRALVNAIMKLLSKDQKGNLKPSRVIQLRKMAEELNNQRLLEGVRVIEESYQPVISKTFIRCDYKDADNNGAWTNVPLGITEA